MRRDTAGSPWNSLIALALKNDKSNFAYYVFDLMHLNGEKHYYEVKTRLDQLEGLI